MPTIEGNDLAWTRETSPGRIIRRAINKYEESIGKGTSPLEAISEAVHICGFLPLANKPLSDQIYANVVTALIDRDPQALREWVCNDNPRLPGVQKLADIAREMLTKIEPLL